MKITEDMLKDIKSQDFLLNKHDVMVDGEMQTHWDIRIPDNTSEWRMVGNPVESDQVIGIEATSDPRRTLDVGNVRIGAVDTEITRIDSGKVQIVESTYIFDGDQLKGAWLIEQYPGIPKGRTFTKVD
jgi:hypothetical protein